MEMIHRMLVAGALAAITVHPAGAQRGAGGRGGTRVPANPPRAQAQQPDTGKKAPGFAFDFQDQELRVVLDAIAAAGELNVAMTNIPQQRVTVHMGRPVARDEMVNLLKTVAESNGLKFTETPTLIQIIGPEAQPRNAFALEQARLQALERQTQEQQTLRLYTYRLKHASAVQLAPVLTNLFTGASGGVVSGRGATIIPNPNGGFQILGSPLPAGNITTIATPFGGRGGRGAAAANNAIQQIAGSLSAQSNDIRIIPEESSNSLLVRATDSDWALVQQVIQGVDLRPLQVLIEVTIAEVQRTHDLDVGVSGTAKIAHTGQNPSSVSVTAPSQANARDFIFELTGGHGTVNYDVAIAALEERGDVRVLSLPVIIAENNRQAVLNVGSSRPFVQVSQTVPNDPTGRVQTVQYIDVATTLTITPTINPDGYVNLQLSQTDNSATNEVQFDAPVISKREATTQVFIRDGQTTVIGGLADNTRTRDVSGIPILSRIPLIGSLFFGNTTRNDDTTELFVFLTPHIISSDEDIDKLRDAVQQGSDLLKQVPVGPRFVPQADTIHVPRPPADSVKKDSLTPPRRPPVR